MLITKMDFNKIERREYNINGKTFTVMNATKLYIDILPKRKVWLKYIKGRKKMLEYPRWALDIISTHYQVNLQEAKNYAEMFLLTEGGAYELAELFGKYGVEPKEIKKLGLPIE